MNPDKALQPALFYIGREEVSQTLVTGVREGLSPLRDLPVRIGRGFSGSISTRYGMHLAITGKTFTPVFRDDLMMESSLTTADMMEFVEYDPVRHSLMINGIGEPPVSAPMHWFAFRCFPHRRSCLHMRPVEDLALPGSLERVAVDPVVFDSNVCLRIMETLKEHPVVGLDDGSVIATGSDLGAASRRLVDALTNGEAGS